MEFGLFLNGYLPGPAAHNPDAEHTMLEREIEYSIHADGYNWKYAWFGEHHALTEYSHMSAPECVIPYVAAKTERIHLGSAIMNLSPKVNQPTRNAERVAMLDHVTQGRYESGTGRGEGEHEMQTFDPTSETKRDCALRSWHVHSVTTPSKGVWSRRRTTSSPSRTARATLRCGSAAAIPAPSPRPASWASARSRSTSSPSTT
jgi:hypothetical protein